MLIDELKLLLGLASRSLEVESSSLSVAACIGPGALCTQGLTRTLTGSVMFRLVQHQMTIQIWHVLVELARQHLDPSLHTTVDQLPFCCFDTNGH